MSAPVDVLPRHRIGAISPLDLIDSSTFEFYKIAPPGAILASISIGLGGFDPESAQAAFTDGALRCVRTLAQRSVSVTMLNGLPLLLNLPTSDLELYRAECARHGITGADGFEAAVAAIHSLGLRTVTVGDKWDAALNERLRAALAAEGIEIVGLATDPHTADQVKGSYESGAELAFALAERAHEAEPEADGIYLAGGAWLTLHLLDAIEQRFGKPVVAGQQSVHWYSLNLAGCYEPVAGRGSLLNSVLAGTARDARAAAKGA